METGRSNNAADGNEKSIISEVHFREILDKMLEGVQVIDFNWRHIYVNDAIVLQSHFSKDELIGFTMMERYPGIEQSEVFAILKECMEKRISKHADIEFEFPDKRKAWFQLSIQPVKEGIFILSIETTERKAAENKILQLNQDLELNVNARTSELEAKVQQLKESEEKFQKAFYASAAGISITRLQGSVFVDFNEAFMRLTGYSRDELLGKSSVELGLVAVNNDRGKFLEALKSQDVVRDIEISMRTKSGRQIHVLCSIAIIVLNNEPFVLSILYDITDRKRALDELEIVNKELEAFAYSVSHDLRAPLRSIIGYSQILGEDMVDQLDDNNKRTLRIIQGNANKMNKLIDDLLGFAKLGKAELHKAEIVSARIVKSCIDQVTEGRGSSAQLVVKPLSNVQADWEMLSQVWINLIANAIKYSSKVPEPVVEIGEEKSEKEIIFYVRDNGVGFDMEYAGKLFGVFQRLHSAEQFEGTGVGLSIVKRIVVKHGGRVWAKAQKDVGATFYFSLPIEQGF